jgi:hypothetical protein
MGFDKLWGVLAIPNPYWNEKTVGAIAMTKPGDNNAQAGQPSYRVFTANLLPLFHQYCLPVQNAPSRSRLLMY